MDCFEKIKSAFDKAENIVLIPHTNADGDATGSCFALAMFLEKFGKKVDVVFEEFPRLTKIIPYDYKVFDGSMKNYDLAVAVDCADLGRMGSRAELFCGSTVCIDHHKTNGSIADINYVEPESAATGELIFELISAVAPNMLDTRIAEALYMAISADTGCFKYSNVTVRTHRIAEKLYEIGGRFAEINRLLYDTVPIKKLKFQASVVNDIEFYCKNRIAVYYLSYKDYTEKQLTLGDVEFVSSMIKTIEGVNIGVFIHEREEGMCKISLRSDESLDAAAVAAVFGGGGHSRAAGFTADGAGKGLIEKVVNSIEDNLVIN